MKKIVLYIVALMVIGFTMGSCETELKEYDGTEGVYFYVRSFVLPNDTVTKKVDQNTLVEFSRILGDVHDISLDVMITGRTKSYDRQFRVTVDADSSTAVEGVNYEPLKEYYTVKAGESSAKIPVRVFRHENIRTEEKRLDLKLVPTDDFVIGIPVWRPLHGVLGSATFDASRHTIRINGSVVVPPRWPSAVIAGPTESGYWGTFTEKKFLLICERFALTYDDFLTDNTMPNARRISISEIMAKYLQKLYNDKNPILEDDGRLMWFNGVSWSSVIGTPWNGEY